MRESEVPFKMANSGDTLEQFKDQAFYSSEPPKLRPETRDVLEKYSKIPSDEVESHVATIVRPISRTAAKR